MTNLTGRICEWKACVAVWAVQNGTMNSAMICEAVSREDELLESQQNKTRTYRRRVVGTGRRQCIIVVQSTRFVVAFACYQISSQTFKDACECTVSMFTVIEWVGSVCVRSSDNGNFTVNQTTRQNRSKYGELTNKNSVTYWILKKSWDHVPPASSRWESRPLEFAWKCNTFEKSPNRL